MTDAYLNRIATAVLGFDMVLSGRVPSTIAAGLPSCVNDILNGGGTEDLLHFAVHPGGRTVLDAEEESDWLPKESRDILRRFGNRSSATVMFVLREMTQPGTPAGRGCAMAFGPVSGSRACASKPQPGDS